MPSSLIKSAGTSWVRRVLHTGFLAFLAIVAAVVPATAQNEIMPIQLMTYNTALMNLQATVYFALLSPQTISIDTNSAAYGGQPYADRIALMAGYIKQEDPDVVVLNEVWHADSKDAFIEQLATNGPYKHYIRRIVGNVPGMNNPFAVPGTASTLELVTHALADPTSPALVAFNQLAGPLLPTGPIVSVDVQFLDSGIMLFSKKPFVKFDNPSFLNDPAVHIEGTNGWGTGPSEVAAVVYHGARGMDQLASKAAGLVRIQYGPKTVVNAVFSHTNADEGPPEENADVRKAQMAEVRNMLLRSLTANELRSEQIYMLGDLNTPGSNQKLGTPQAEWTKVFGKAAAGPPSTTSPGIFFACGDGADCSGTSGALNPAGTFMTDSWGFETSVLDLSKTNYIDGQYYDYVLQNKVHRQCMQHIRIGSEMRDDVSGTQLSDHLPVHVDFNILAAHCTPNDDSFWGPQIVTLTPAQPKQSYGSAEGAKLTFPGSMQWYKLPDPGTYWILMGAGNTAFDVYRADDLSEPIHPYHGETDPERGKRFVSEVPLYVRVFAVHPDGTPDRSWTGTYSMRFQRALGTTAYDSIGLLPAVRTRYDWVSSGIDQPVVWFDFWTNQATLAKFAQNTVVNETGQGGVDWLGTSAISKNELYVQTGANQHAPASYTKIDLSPANPGGFAKFFNPDYKMVTGYQVEMPKLKGKPVSDGIAPKKYYYKMTRDSSLGQLPQNLYTFLTFLTDLQYLQPVALRAQSPAYDANEPAWIGFTFDGGLPSLCPWGPSCKRVDMHSPTPDPLTAVKAFVGPFKNETLPELWVGPGPLPPLQPLVKIEGTPPNGQKIRPISIQRGDRGNVLCRININKNLGDCNVMFITSPYGFTYDYQLYYGVVHDLP
ncbi:MAG: endonuclease/exonuclease/phosphatase family protein [Thermoanaerobaculia bacterium]